MTSTNTTVQKPAKASGSTLTFGNIVITAEQRVKTEAFLPRDRCERCGAQAFMRAVHPESAEKWSFCGYHGRMNVKALLESGYRIDDQTHLINASGGASA